MEPILYHKTNVYIEPCQSNTLLDSIVCIRRDKRSKFWFGVFNIVKACLLKHIVCRIIAQFKSIVQLISDTRHFHSSQVH